MSNSANPRTVACQAPLSMGFPKEECGLLFPFQGDLPNPGIKHGSCALPADSLPLSHQGSPSLCPQLSSVHFTQSCLTLCDPMECTMPSFPVHHQLLELAQTHVHRVGDAIQPPHSLSSPSPPGFNRSQHQGLYQ